MIDTKALREKILDLAMRGKLVPQDLTDEPASELLKRIKVEKEQLIKEKKIRRDKNETEIFRSDDGLYYEKFQDGTVKELEVPYELPEGWAWSKLRCLSENLAYGTSKKSLPLGNTPVLRMGNLQNGMIDWNSLVYTNELQDIEKYKLIPGDILFNRTNSPDLVGKTSTYDGKYQAIFAGYLIRIRMVSKHVNTEFINYIMNAPFTKRHSLLVKSDAVSQSNINATKLGDYLIPVAPTNEQRKIVQQITKYFSLINIIETEQESLGKLSEQLKKKVLDTAMRGKLVPQDPNDEPASVLLEKIREEKQELYEEGKLKKRDLERSVIFKGDDNSYYKKIGNKTKKVKVPYNIPDSWEWCYLADVIQLISGRDLAKSQYNDQSQGVPYITGASNFQNDTIHTDRYTLEPQSLSKKNDLLISVKGTIGKIAFNPFPNSHIARQIMSLRGFGLNLKYVQYYLEFSLEEIQSQAQSMIPGISRDVLLKSFIPIPPKDEVKRIIESISLIKNTSL